MRRARGILLATAVAALLAPASAHATLGWYDAGAGVPASVDLKSVTRSGDVVIAVGSDSASGTDVPAIYRYDGAAWWRDTLPAGTTGKLLDVATNPAGDAWAVGVGGNGTSPLLVHLPKSPPQPTVVDDPLGTIPPAAAREWTVPTLAPGPAALRTVRMSSAGGYAGDSAGKLWSVTATGLADAGTIPARVAGTSAGQSPAVNGVAVTGSGAGYAVTDGGLAEDRIFRFGAKVEPELTVPDAAGASIQSVAFGDGKAMAVDSGGYWQPNAAGAWQRDTAGLGPGEPVLSDISIATGVIAVGGRMGADGVVWRRTGTLWSHVKVASAAINGVFAYGSADIWAVGDDGTLVNYYNKADPSTTCVNCGGTGGDTGSGTGGDSGMTFGSTTTTSGNTQTTVIPPQKKGDPTVFIVEPVKKPGTNRPRRLLDRVKVLRRGKRLIVSFRLRARARVAIAAKRGRRVVSRSRSRAMRPGRRRVVLPFKGSPPNQLRIVVRPLRATRAR